MTDVHDPDGNRASTAPGDTVTPPKGLPATESGYLASLVTDNKVVSLLAYGTFVLFKVLAVSHWNLATALAILAASSISELILGAFLSALPMLLLVFFSCTIFLWLSGHWGRRSTRAQPTGGGGVRAWARSRRPVMLTTGALMVAMVLLPPAPAVLICTGAAVLLGLLARVVDPHWRRGPSRHEPVLPAGETPDTSQGAISGRDYLSRNWTVLRSSRPTFSAAILLAMLLAWIGYNQLAYSVWLPHEQVNCVGCRAPVVGYVLAESGDGVTILVSGSRVVRVIPSERVLSRVVCTIPYSWPLISHTSDSKTFAQRLGLVTDLVPSCPHPTP